MRSIRLTVAALLFSFVGVFGASAAQADGNVGLKSATTMHTNGWAWNG